MEQTTFEYDSSNGIRIQNWQIEQQCTAMPTAENQCKLVYITRGKLIAVIHGQRIECGTGEVVVLPENAYYALPTHRVKRTQEGEKSGRVAQGQTELIAVNFFPAIMPIFISPNVIQLDAKMAAKYRISASTAKKHNLFRSFKKILTLAQRQKLYKDAFIMAEIIQLVAGINVAIGETMKTVSVDKTKKGKKNIFEVCVKYINDNITKPLGLNELAKELYFSKSYLQHIFKQKTGMSISAYINERKMTVARAMLENGGSPSVVAKQLGYEYYTTFSVKFKQFHGITPKEIVKELETKEKKEE